MGVDRGMTPNVFSRLVAGLALVLSATFTAAVVPPHVGSVAFTASSPVSVSFLPSG
ncbi:MAG: hypothetical protein ACYDB2_05585 [Acidimicrobiales bacterium]